MKKIEVVAGIIFFQDQILCVQRPQNKLLYISEKFEFPGGKIGWSLPLRIPTRGACRWQACQQVSSFRAMYP